MEQEMQGQWKHIQSGRGMERESLWGGAANRATPLPPRAQTFPLEYRSTKRFTKSGCDVSPLEGFYFIMATPN